VKLVVDERDEVVPCVHVGAATMAKGRELPADVVFGVVLHHQHPPAELPFGAACPFFPPCAASLDGDLTEAQHDAIEPRSGINM
jgi:hypothetical protein